MEIQTGKRDEMPSTSGKRRGEDGDRDDASSYSSSSEENSSRRRDHKKRKRKHRDDRKKKSKKKKRKRSSRGGSDGEDDDHSNISHPSHDEEERSSRKKRRRDDDRSVSTSSSSDYSDDYSSDDRRSKKKKKKRHKDHSKSKKRKKEKKKRHKSSKESSEKKNEDDGLPSFGKYGVLKANDYHKQQRSFTVWLEEVKGILSFSGPKWELQNYFKDYMEDFNTATLPHIKYYDYEKWEMEDYQKNNAASATSNKSTAQRDEALHMQSLQEKAQEKRHEEIKLVRNMMSTEKREEMKRKAELQAEMAHAYKTGDQETYLRLKSRLEPER
jgi:hypothetical protein